MQRLRRRRAHAGLSLSLTLACAAFSGGCASPGPPHPPSLRLPQIVSDLSATRSGDQVELHFSVPTHTTDGQLLRQPTLLGSLCRQVGDGPCLLADAAETRMPLAVPAGEAQPVLWTDPLPPVLLTGAPRAIAYRVGFRNAAGKSAGYSDPAYAAAGQAPAPVAGLKAAGTRAGVALRWTPVPQGGEVLLERRQSDLPRSEQPVPAETVHTSPHDGTAKAARVAEKHTSRRQSGVAGELWLQASPGDLSAFATIDGSVEPAVSYTYIALRRDSVKLGGRTLELRSAPSAPVSITWRDVYPPAAPQGLAALGYAVMTAPPGQATNPAHEPSGYAVDLVWQPVEDPRLAGYLVYRETLNAAGAAVSPRVRLTPAPLVTPGYHDATAKADCRYRYSVTAIDPKGNESSAAQTMIEPSGTP